MTAPDEDLIEFRHLPLCGELIRAPRSSIGEWIECPVCGSDVLVRDPSAPPPHPEIGDDEWRSAGGEEGAAKRPAAGRRSEAARAAGVFREPRCSTCRGIPLRLFTYHRWSGAGALMAAALLMGTGLVGIGISRLAWEALSGGFLKQSWTSDPSQISFPPYGIVLIPMLQGVLFFLAIVLAVRLCFRSEPRLACPSCGQVVLPPMRHAVAASSGWSRFLGRTRAILQTEVRFGRKPDNKDDAG